MRQLKHVVKLNRPFAVYIEPGDVLDGELQWYAKIVGYELDNMTWGNSPVNAMVEAVDLLKTLSGRCKDEVAHTWDEEASLDTSPAWRCSTCGEIAAKTEFDDYGS